MEDLESKVLQELTTLGCTSGKQRILCYLLYVYLLEKVRLHELKCAYSETIRTPYLLGSRTLKESAIYVAVPAGTPLTITQIEEFQQLCNESYPTLHLGFIDGDSTTVLYSVTRGLMDPKEPEGLVGRKKREERRNMIDSKIQGKRDQIIECALKHGVQDEAGIPSCRPCRKLETVLYYRTSTTRTSRTHQALVSKVTFNEHKHEPCKQAACCICLARNHRNLARWAACRAARHECEPGIKAV